MNLIQAVNKEPLDTLRSTFTCPLHAFLSNTKVKALLDEAQDPAPLPPESPRPTRIWTSLRSCMDSLKSLTKVMADLQKKANTPVKQDKRPQSKQQALFPSKTAIQQSLDCTLRMVSFRTHLSRTQPGSDRKVICKLQFSQG